MVIRAVHDGLAAKAERRGGIKRGERRSVWQWTELRDARLSANKSGREAANNHQATIFRD